MTTNTAELVRQMKEEQVMPRKVRLGTLRAKRNWSGWESNTPRCENCKHMNNRRAVLRNSLPVKLYYLCGKFAFETKPNACCDHWQSSKGERLECA